MEQWLYQGTKKLVSGNWNWQEFYGYKLERRNDLENMCEQIQYMTDNESRTERININQEYRDYESSDDE